MTRSTSYQEPVKGGMILHWCCVCDGPAWHGLVPPAVPAEVAYCDAHCPPHLWNGRARDERRDA